MLPELLNLWDYLIQSISQIRILDVLDIAIITLAVYWLLRLATKTRAMQVVKGLGLVFLLSRITDFIGLTGITYLLNYIIGAGAVILVVVFQPEIRRALESLGRGRYFSKAGLPLFHQSDISWVGEELLGALLSLAKSRTGALVVVEAGPPLDDIIQTGTQLDAVVSQPLIENIFRPGSPLHDGAIVLQGDRIAGAGCFLPLSAQDIDRQLGTRHRAALGMSENSPATVFVVSEETGAISKAAGGELERNMDVRALRGALDTLFVVSETPQTLGEWIRRKRGRDDA
ncbi:MAG: diadenylate cyclase CdaA [Clostridia bacterium]|nr:diadenylate cyclase CdaA [Clostridia bacterium]